MDVDVDLERLDREALVKEVRRLRAGIRAHLTAPVMTCAGTIRSSGRCCRNGSSQQSRYRRGQSSSAAVWHIENRWIANSRQRRLRTSNTTFEMLAAASESLGDKCETATRGSIV